MASDCDLQIAFSGNETSRTPLTLTMASAVFREFTEKDIKTMTNNFSSMLGSGSAGEVYSGIWGGNAVAVKQLPLVKFEERQAWQKEVRMLQIFSEHENIVNFYGHGTGVINTKGYLVMEHLPISLTDIVECNSAEVSQWKDLISVIIQIAEGLKYIHDKDTRGGKRYIYVDMKPDNVMLSKIDQNYIAKIVDLGSIVMEGEANPTYTHGFAAPGVEGSRTLGSSNRRVDVKSDVYAFGKTVEALLGKEKISKKKEAAAMYKKKGKGKEARQPDIVGKLVKKIIPNDLVNEMTSLVCDCTNDWKDRRPDMAEVLNRLRRMHVSSSQGRN